VNAPLSLLKEGAPTMAMNSNGATVSLDDVGYQVVALQRSDAHMKTFIERVLAAGNGQAKDEGELVGFTQWYSGHRLAQSYENLVKELSNASWVDGFHLGATASLDEHGYQSVASLQNDAEMKAFVLRVILAGNGTVQDSTHLQGFAPWYSGTSTTQTFNALVSELATSDWVNGFSQSLVLEQNDHPPLQHLSLMANRLSLGMSAPLDAEGYQLVAALRSDDEMKAFVRRVVDAGKGDVKDEGELRGLTQWYSGTLATQHFDRLVQELQGAMWISGFHAGRIAALNEAGYQSVAALKRDDEMSDFITRVIHSGHGHITPGREDELRGLTQWYSGTYAVQAYQTLVEELAVKDWVNGFVLGPHQPHPTQDAGVFAQMNATTKGVLVASKAALDMTGYQEVVSLQNDRAMGAFIERLLLAGNATVTDHVRLASFAQWYSGVKATQSFQKLVFELKNAGWASGFAVAAVVPLNEEGYQMVADLKDNAEMKTFIARLVRLGNATISDDSKLEGFALWYSGVEATQTFKQLMSELSSMDWVSGFLPSAIAIGPAAVAAASGVYGEQHEAKHNKRPRQQKKRRPTWLRNWLLPGRSSEER